MSREPERCTDPRHGVEWDTLGNPAPCARCRPEAARLARLKAADEHERRNARAVVSRPHHPVCPSCHGDGEVLVGDTRQPCARCLSDREPDYDDKDDAVTECPF